MKNPSGYCFVAGMLILTSFGFANIEDIRPGDYVYTMNLESHTQELKPVLETYEREVMETYTITIEGEDIETTAEHPFYVPEEGFVNAEDLEVGDEVELADGDTGTVEDVEVNELNSPVTVYNFAVMDTHTYYVGETGVLVHNMCKPCQSAADKALDDAGDVLDDIESSSGVLPNAEDLKMSQTVQNHANDVIKKGPNAGQSSRPYIDSDGTTLLLKEIMESAEAVPDAVLQSGLRWDVSGAFRGATGTWELVVDTSKNMVVHFNFVAH